MLEHEGCRLPVNLHHLEILFLFACSHDGGPDAAQTQSFWSMTRVHLAFMYLVIFHRLLQTTTNVQVDRV
jgi:hypothetical protein